MPTQAEWRIILEGTDIVTYNIEKYAKQYRERSLRVLDKHAKIIKEDMKQTHKWQNRTYAAEANLNCIAEDGQGGIIRLIAFHGVPYGIFLETMQRGKFAVLRPTLLRLWPAVMADLRRVAKGQEPF